MTYCLLEELDRLDILPWGWVMLRRSPNTDPKDGFVEVRMTGDVDLIEQNNTLLRAVRAANEMLNHFMPIEYAGYSIEEENIANLCDALKELPEGLLEADK